MFTYTDSELSFIGTDDAWSNFGSFGLIEMRQQHRKRAFIAGPAEEFEDEVADVAFRRRAELLDQRFDLVARKRISKFALDDIALISFHDARLGRFGDAHQRAQ